MKGPIFFSQRDDHLLFHTFTALTLIRYYYGCSVLHNDNIELSPVQNYTTATVSASNIIARSLSYEMDGNGDVS
jgi:hypothetical protein